MNIPILLYHSVSSQSTDLYRPWAVSPDRFDKHMAYLSNSGFQPLAVKDILNTIKSGSLGTLKRPVGITFDDGLADFFDGAYPILKKYRFPATLYIATGYVGETSRWLADLGEQNRPMMSWDQITSLDGIEIGSHTHSHPQLDIVPENQARDEILQSKKMLENHLNRSIDTFAFPHGYHTRKLLKIVKSAGYNSACIVDHRMANAEDDVLSLPRIIVTADVSTTTLAEYLNGKGLRRKSLLSLPMKFTWRMVRRMKLERFLPATDRDFSSTT